MLSYLASFSFRGRTNGQRDDRAALNSLTAKIQFVDQTAELENFYATDEPELESERQEFVTAQHLQQNGTVTQTATVPTPPSCAETTTLSPPYPSIAKSPTGFRSPTGFNSTTFESFGPYPAAKRRKTNDSSQLPPISQEIQQSIPYYQSPSNASVHTHQASASYVSPREVNETRRIEQEYARIADNQAAQIPDEPFLSVSSWKRNFRWPNQYTTQQCRCLFRYYIDILGHWFDVGDPTRQFTTIVPQRAKRSPPLLNAIFSAAALHLRHSFRIHHPGQVPHYSGYELRDLDEVSTIKYYLATNAYLRVLCNNEDHTRDEDLLAATVIMRFYEELAELISGEPRDQLTRPFQLFVAAQAKPNTFHFPPEHHDFQVQGAFALVRHVIEPYLNSYQHASFRIALRQECQRALLARRQVDLPLGTWHFLEGFDETEDSVWTDRHLYHYARVLQYCFSHDEHAASKAERWDALKGFERLWEETRPLSFSPYHRTEPDRAAGQIFPRYWYVNEVHTVGIMYYHLSRLLLCVYNPHIHRIGPGAAAAQRRVSAQVREIVIEICGVATSSLDTQPVLVNAYNSIAMFGEHFADRKEQEGLLEILDELERRHGWPVGRDKEHLCHGWEWHTQPPRDSNIHMVLS